jgi:Flp pilus assembly protein TadG
MARLMIRRRLICDRGSELIEFTLVTPLLLLVLFGIVDFGLLFRRYEVLTNAAREGARVAAIPGYTNAQIQQRVTDYLNASGLSVPATFPGTVAVTTDSVSVGGTPECFMTVKGVTFNYTNNFLAFGRIITLIGGGTGFASKTLTLTAKMRYEGAALTCPVTGS